MMCTRDQILHELGDGTSESPARDHKFQGSRVQSSVVLRVPVRLFQELVDFMYSE